MMVAHKVPGASFAIGFDGQIVWSEGFGFADLENHVKASPRHRLPHSLHRQGDDRHGRAATR